MMRKVLLATMGLLGLGALVVCQLGYTCNSHGNAIALKQVEGIAGAALAGASEAPDHSFLFASANAKQREALTHYLYSWRRTGRFLVSNRPVLECDPNPRRIIVVCDSSFRNVPVQRFGSAPPTHAAGFADGSHGLISTAEFATLDRSTFTPLHELYPPVPK